MASLVFDNVGMRYQSTAALKGVNLHIADGEFVSIVGSSGSGKSTLLRIIAGLERQTSGHVTIGDRCVDAVRSAHRGIAMVFQSYALYPHLSAFANIAMPLTMTRLSPFQRLPLVGKLSPGARTVQRQIASDVASIASMLEIDKLLDRKPGQLSGGQRQRIALGRAVIRHPQIFLMDEPLSNLDAALRVQMRAELVALHRRLGTTFVHVTHYQTEALTMSDRVALMADGELLQVGTPADIYERPQTLKVARFIGSARMNILPATVWDQRAQHAKIAVAVNTIADGMTAHLGKISGLDIRRYGIQPIKFVPRGRHSKSSGPRADDVAVRAGGPANSSSRAGSMILPKALSNPRPTASPVTTPATPPAIGAAGPISGADTAVTNSPATMLARHSKIPSAVP